MASYNVDRNFDTMRQEAIERVREMQRRSRSFVEPRPSVPREAAHTENPPAPEPKPHHENKNPGQNNKAPRDQNVINQILGSIFPKTSGKPRHGGSISELLDSFNIDEEKVLIGMLIYILAKNGADVKLLIGLGYLLL